MSDEDEDVACHGHGHGSKFERQVVVSAFGSIPEIWFNIFSSVKHEKYV